MSHSSSILSGRLSWLYVLLCLVVGSLWISYAYVIVSSHTGQRFMKSMTYTPFYKDGQITASLKELTGKLYEERDERKKTVNIPYAKGERRFFTFWSETAFSDYRAHYDLELDRENRVELGDIEPRQEYHVSTRMHPFVAFIPQIIVGNIAYYLELRPIQIYYGVDLFMVLLAAVTGFVVLRLAPAMQWPLFFMLLIPCVFATRMGMYPDGITSMSSLLFFVLLLRALADPGRMLRFWDYFSFIGVGAVLAAAKLVYFPLLFSTLLIPKNRFGGSSFRKYCFVVLVAGSGLVASSAFFDLAMKKDYWGFNPAESTLLALQTAPWITGREGPTVTVRPQREDQPAVYLNGSKPISRREYSYQFIIHYPHLFLKRMGKMHDGLLYPEFYARGLLWWIVAYKNPSAYVLPYTFPQGLLVIGMLVLAGALSWVTREKREGECDSRIITMAGRLWLLALVVGTYVLIFAALFMLMPVSNGIHGIQGRYFYPLLPFLMLALCWQAETSQTLRKGIGLIVIFLTGAAFVVTHGVDMVPYWVFLHNLSALVSGG